jgi:hypothetical protein
MTSLAMPMPTPSLSMSMPPTPLTPGRPLPTPMGINCTDGRLRHPAGTPQGHPFNVVLTSAGLQPVGSDELVWGTLSYREPLRTDYFTTRLPRELKIHVFQNLMSSFGDEPGTRRWNGVNAGRRELVRLSSVSTPVANSGRGAEVTPIVAWRMTSLVHGSEHALTTTRYPRSGARCALMDSCGLLPTSLRLQE